MTMNSIISFVSAKLGKYVPWVLCAVLLAVLLNSCYRNNKLTGQLTNDLKIQQDSIKHFKNKNGELVNQVKVIQLTASQLKQDGEAFGLEKDQMKKEIGNLNNLVSYYKGKLKVTQQFVSVAKDSIVKEEELSFLAEEDTVKNGVRKIFDFKTKYLSLHQIYNPRTDSMSSKYDYFSDFKYYTYWKKQGLLKPKDLYADFALSDPNAKLTNATAVHIVQPPKRVYEQNWFWGAVGLIAGLLIGK